MERFSRFVFLLALVPITALAVPADREARHHVIVTPAGVLTDADRAALADEGIELQRPLSGGRFLARVDDVSVAEKDARIGNVRALGMRDKIHATAWRVVASGRPFANVRIFFNDDVSIDDARAAVLAAGGALDDPLATRLEPLQSATARIPATALTALAADDRVVVVYGARNFRTTNWNATAALLSHVSDVQASPYNLAGNGVVLTYFELGVADATHPEFGGRLSVTNFPCSASDTECNATDNKTHSTHVGGTMIAAGLQPAAKGMAPSATLYEFRGNYGSWLTQKETSLKALGSVADNNSWGYVLGWTSDPDGSNWQWNEGEELIGGYSGDINAVYDHVARTNGTLGIYSAGNDANVGGPTQTPYLHYHVDSQGDRAAGNYCYSTNGSGNDCPTALGCTAGTQYCETVRHPTHNATSSNPGGSIGWTASSKNTVAVGSTSDTKTISYFSSRGPTKDGRVKPEITAKGQSLYSTTPGNSYARLQGTSMSSPVVTGTMALFAEQWRKMNGGVSPLPEVLKALLIAGADDLGNPGPDYTYGFGFLNAKASVDLIIADSGVGKRVKVASVSQGSSADYPLTLAAGQSLRVVLTWFDPEVLPLGSEDVAAKALLNDLDVKVVDPNGVAALPYVLNPASPGANATRGVNTIDNTEELELTAAAAGTYHLIVNGTAVPQGPQQYVLVANTDLGAAAASCADVTEPNETTAAAYGLAIAQPVAASICSTGDVDYFKFTTTSAGAVTVSVTAGATALKATLLLNGNTVSTVNVAAGATQQLSTTAAAGTSPYLVRVEPQGALGSSGDYLITATYPYSSTPRRHGVRH